MIQKLALTNLNSEIWTKKFRGLGFDELKSVVETATGYLLTGNSNSNISQTKFKNSRDLLDFWIINTDLLGNIVWQKTIGGNNNDSVSTVIILSDGYLIGGTSNSNISGEKTKNSFGGSDFWIVKIDFNGELIWQKTIGSTSNEILKKIKKPMMEIFC